MATDFRERYLGDPWEYERIKRSRGYNHYDSMIEAYEYEIKKLKNALERELYNRPMYVVGEHLDSCDCKKQWNYKSASKKLLLMCGL